MEATRDLVSRAAEFATRVEDRVHDLERGLPRLLLLVGRDAAAVVRDGDGVIFADPDIDTLTRAVHRLVDRVVEHFTDEVMKTPEIGRADVHAGPAADGLEPLEDLDVLGAV